MRRRDMNDKHLYILWTNADIITSEKMVLMYGINAKLKGWWEDVTIIVWGATASLVAENQVINDHIAFAISKGIHVTACKACADQLNVTDVLVDMGIEVKYWGEGLTELIKSKANLLTI